jgi:hypothetical protein
MVFKSAWMPAPPPESDPAMVNIRGITIFLLLKIDELVKSQLNDGFVKSSPATGGTRRAKNKERGPSGTANEAQSRSERDRWTSYQAIKISFLFRARDGNGFLYLSPIKPGVKKKPGFARHHFSPFLLQGNPRKARFPERPFRFRKEI